MSIKDIIDIIDLVTNEKILKILKICIIGKRWILFITFAISLSVLFYPKLIHFINIPSLLFLKISGYILLVGSIIFLLSNYFLLKKKDVYGLVCAIIFSILGISGVVYELLLSPPKNTFVVAIAKFEPDPPNNDDVISLCNAFVNNIKDELGKRFEQTKDNKVQLKIKELGTVLKGTFEDKIKKAEDVGKKERAHIVVFGTISKVNIEEQIYIESVVKDNYYFRSIKSDTKKLKEKADIPKYVRLKE